MLGFFDEPYLRSIDCAPNHRHAHAGIYEPESFKRESKYGLTVLTTMDEGLLKYLNQIMAQMEHWLLDGHVQRLVVVVSGLDSGDTLERWQFNVTVDEPAGSNGSTGDENKRISSISSSLDKKGKKSIREIHNEIQAIIRQITASVSKLYLLEYCNSLYDFILISFLLDTT